MDILNDDKYFLYVPQFRDDSIQKYPATEIAYINRHLSGEDGFVVGKDFSLENLELITMLKREEKNGKNM